jgi:adenylate cyclase class IV
VDKLGTFLELETVVKKSLVEARKEYGEVVNFLDLERYKKLNKSYSDMLLAK